MPLKTLVKVGNITNLSDARYCAGMGVDMLGFGVLFDQPHHIVPTLYQEIRGWISGPATVAQVSGILDPMILNEVIEQYRPDFLELEIKDLLVIKNPSTLPLIIKVKKGESLETLDVWKDQIAYVEFDSPEGVIDTTFNSFVNVHDKRQVQQLLSDSTTNGISLSGTEELRPGFKSYDGLSDILEALEAD